MDEEELQAFVLSAMPDYISINFQRVLRAEGSEERVKTMVHVYWLILHTLATILISQYLIRDRETIQNQQLNGLLLNTFPREMTLDAWQNLLFLSLQVYEGNRNLLFMPELYDLYWDVRIPHQIRSSATTLFGRLSQISFELETPRFAPHTLADWQQYESELLPLIHRLFQEVAFLSRYDLIRVLDFDTSMYDFELHKGVEISRGRRVLDPLARLTRGWFYLRNERDEVLLLHPLLILWDLEQSDSDLPSLDSGLYDRLKYNHMQYMLAVQGISAIDEQDRNLQEFVELVIRTVEDVKRKRQVSEQLTWPDLRDLCAQITHQRMETARNKFVESLYSQRASIRSEVLKFLASDKRCFVLIGKSGVGKSSFLVALGDELSHSRGDLAVLMYDGAQGSEETSISTLVAKDFNDRLIIAGKHIDNVWHEMAMVEDISGRHVVLCVDAINESARARDLLRQLNELAQGPWPWLKIIFTSRPETWRSIRRSVRLAEALYYTKADSDILELGSGPFNYSEQMEPFSRDELPAAYARYQSKFRLKTAFEEIPSALKEVLREPLNLWLVSSTHRDRQIPGRLQISNLIDKYVQELVRTERLDLEDLELLEKQLVPLMARPNDFSYMLTSDDLDSVDDSLRMRLYSEQRLSDGRLVNQSFRNLLDTEILALLPGKYEQRIGFKFERFYEHFVGRHLYKLSQSQASRTKYFQFLTSMTSKYPYLWGATRNALIEDVRHQGSDTALRLCHTDQQRMKEMMVDVLTSFGRDDFEKAENLLRELLPPDGKRRRRRQQVHSFARKGFTSAVIPMRNAGKIAVEAASELGMAGILRVAALQTDPTIRTAAVRHAYRLWQSHRDSGFDLLAQLAQKATKTRIPDFIAFESTLGLSLVIFFDHIHDEQVLMRLGGIWHETIGRLLAIQETSGRLRRLLGAFIRERLMSLAISIGFRMLRDFPEYNVLSYAGLQAFFRLSKADKELFGRMIRYLDTQGQYSKEDLQRDFMTVLRIRKDVMVTPICMLVLSAHAVADPQTILPFLARFQESARHEPEANAWVGVPPIVSEAILDRDASNDVAFEVFLHAVETCQDYYSSEFGRPAQLTSESPESAYLGSYIYYHFLRSGFVETDWLTSRINAALKRKDTAYFETVLSTHLPNTGIERGQPQAALDALCLFFKSGPSGLDQARHRFLSRLRLYYPDEVDSFLEEQQVAEDVRLQIQTSEPVETIGQLIGLRAFRFLRDDVIIGSPDLRSRVVRIFEQSIACKDTREWMSYLIREAVNIVYGSEALPQPGTQKRQRRVT
jgi:hypothetical protein